MPGHCVLPRMLIIEPLGRPRRDSTLFQFTTRELRRFRSLLDDAIQGLPGSLGAQSQGIRPPAVSDDRPCVADATAT